MATTPPVTGAWTAPSVDEQLLDLICHDTDLLAAEFDAIMTAEWPAPPADRLGLVTARGQPGDEAACRVVGPVLGPVSRPRHPGIGGWARQRSPPRSSTDHLTSKAGDRT
jgi:hypothetical protein